MSGTVPPEPTEEIFARGEVVGGKFEVVELLGRGGMAEVYLVEDMLLERRVALKVMLKKLTAQRESAMFAQRFLREAKVGARIDNRAVVKVFEFGTHEGMPFFIMEYIDGHSLRDAMQAAFNASELLAEGLVKHFLKEAVYGLRGLHRAQGIVHRDLKPANFLIGRDDDDTPCLKIADFGVSHVPDEDLTKTGWLLGSLGYLAPEYFLSRQTDERTDLFALGVTFYDALCQRRPYRINRDEAEGRDYFSQPNVFRFVKRPRSVREGIHPSWDYVLLRLLNPDPELRYQSCDELLDDFERWDVLPEVEHEEVEENRGEILLTEMISGGTAPDSLPSELNFASAVEQPTSPGGRPVSGDSNPSIRDSRAERESLSESMAVLERAVQALDEGSKSKLTPDHVSSVSLASDSDSDREPEPRDLLWLKVTGLVGATLAGMALIVWFGFSTIGTGSGGDAAVTSAQRDETAGGDFPTLDFERPGKVDESDVHRTFEKARREAAKKEQPAVAEEPAPNDPPKPRRGRGGGGRRATAASRPAEAPPEAEPSSTEPQMGRFFATGSKKKGDQKEKKPAFSIPVGTRIEAKLESGIDSLNHGQVVARVTRPVKSDGREVLPRGAVLVGRSSSRSGATRVYIDFMKAETGGKTVQFSGHAVVGGFAGLPATVKQLGPSDGDRRESRAARDSARAGANVAGEIAGALSPTAGRVINQVGGGQASEVGQERPSTGGRQLLVAANTEFQVMVTD